MSRSRPDQVGQKYQAGHRRCRLGDPGAQVVDSAWQVIDEGDDAASAQPDEGGTEEVSWQLLRQQATQIMLARERKSRSIQSFQKKF